MRRILFGVGIICCLTGFTVSDSFDFATQLVRNFEILQQARMQEKIWLHTDRTCFQTGDTVWMRAFLVDAATHCPSLYSRFVYVDLVDRQDSVRKKVKLALIDSVFSGYMPLAEDLPQGDYFLRAYSYWMQNAGEEYIYKKKIQLINPADSKMLAGVTYREVKGERYALIRLFNSRKEPYQKVLVEYRLRYPEGEGKIFQKRTDENGELWIKLEDQRKPLAVWVRFANGLPYACSRYVHLPVDTIDYELAFFPEGGDLITGQEQVIAFKAVGEDGLSVDIDGYLYNDTDSVVDLVKSIHKGMGWLNTKLESGRRYYVRVKSAQGLEKKFYLPAENTAGICLSVHQYDSMLAYSVKTGPQALLPDSLYLLAHVRGQLIVLAPLEGKWIGKIPKADLPEGILHLCILDRKGRIYSQRLCFIRREDRPALYLQTDKKRYTIREAVEVELCLRGTSAQEGRFSLSVTNNETAVRDSLQGDIVSELLLNSDLKGYIEDPGFYFREPTRVVDRCLDLLLLTQGWTRFDVSKVVTGEFEEVKYYLERGQAISGKVKNFWGKDAQQAQLILLSTNMLFDVLHADSSGRFLIDGITFPENTGFIVQARSRKGRRSVEVNIDQEEFLAPILQIPYDRQQANGEDEFYKKYGQDYYYDHGVKVYVLDEAVVRRSVPKKQYSIYDISARHALDSAQLAGAITHDLRMVLMQIPGVIVTGETITYHGEPLYLVLNNFEETFDRIMMMEPQRFLSISLLDDQMAYFYFGDKAKNGALVFTENYDYMPERSKSLSVSSFIPLGYQKPVEFYVPPYDVDSLRIALADTIDLRPTLYWNPNIKLKSSEPTRVRFFMDDGCESCTFTLEGVLNDGTVCREEKNIRLRF